MAGETTSDQRHLNGKKTVGNAALIASAAAAVEQNCRLSIKSFAVAHGVGVGAIHCILQEDLTLLKKSARWVPKLLSQDHKDQRVENCSEFVAASTATLSRCWTTSLLWTKPWFHITLLRLKNSLNSGVQRGNQAPSKQESRPAGPSR